MTDISSEVIPEVKKPATGNALLPAIANRWSPRAFLDKPVSKENVRVLLEAAHWAASSSNEQPWRFIVATKENPADYTRLLSVLVERNQLWAKAAPVLLLSVAKKTSTKSGKPNRFALYDTGAAAATLCIQAAALGLAAHSMGGYDAAKARELFAIPEDFEPGAAIAVGYAGPAESVADDFKAGELAPRTRKPLSEIAFTTTWGTAANL
jgi:nitroreductase